MVRPRILCNEQKQTKNQYMHTLQMLHWLYVLYFLIQQEFLKLKHKILHT